MGLIIKKEQVANARGRKHKRTTVLTFAAPQVFEIAYDASEHRRFVAEEIKSLLRPGRYDLRTAATAQRWRDAINRNAPLVAGFFENEPKLRERMLRWCEKTLGASVQSKRR